MTYTYAETKTIKPSDIYRLRHTYEVPEGYVIVDFRPPLAYETYLPAMLSGVNEAVGNYPPNEPRLILAKVYTLQEALAE